MAIQLSLFEDNNAHYMFPRRHLENGYTKQLIALPESKNGEAYVVIETRPKKWHKLCVGMVTDPIIWGVGTTTIEALDDAVRWIKGFKDYDIEDIEDLLCFGKFTIYPCSTKVFQKVHQYGGEIDFAIKNGRVLLPKEIKDGQI